MRRCGGRRGLVGLQGGPTGGRGALLRVALTSALVGVACGLLAAPAGATQISYVAMGDSYTSAYGVTPYVPTAPPECAQSERNYPHLVASALNLALSDVSCSGAYTGDFTIAQYPDQPPQFDALSASTEVVSVGMSGNDHNLFGTLVNGCTEAGTNHPQEKAPCKKQYSTFVKQTIEEDRAPFEAALAQIHVLSPKAKVFVVGYPEITPRHGTCAGFNHWTEGDLQWFRKVTKTGDAHLKKEAKAKGAMFVDTFKPSEGHNACEPVGTRWVEPLNGSLGAAVHPNATGEEHDALDLEAAMAKVGLP